jgi:hypothetical protein
VIQTSPKLKPAQAWRGGRSDRERRLEDNRLERDAEPGRDAVPAVVWCLLLLAAQVIQTASRLAGFG